MNKIFISADTVRNDAFALAKKLIDLGKVPDIMYVSMRGGAVMGNAMNEFFKLALGEKYATVFATLVAHSYTGVQQHSEVVFDGWTYDPHKLTGDQKILIVDDICDSGSTLTKLSETFAELGLPKNAVHFVVHDYKHFNYDTPRTTGFVPDYYCKKYEINSESENLWIHYLSHELVGLTEEQLRKNYLEKYPQLENVFKGILL